MRKELRRHEANGGGVGPATTVRYDGGDAEKMTVTMEVVLGLFWSYFWSIKYMDKIHRRMYGRWKMMNFLLFNK